MGRYWGTLSVTPEHHSPVFGSSLTVAGARLAEFESDLQCFNSRFAASVWFCLSKLRGLANLGCEAREELLSLVAFYVGPEADKEPPTDVKRLIDDVQSDVVEAASDKAGFQASATDSD